jgi:hypothetical protein
VATGRANPGIDRDLSDLSLNHDDRAQSRTNTLTFLTIEVAGS